ncbi:thiolase family protein [Zhongshania aquimaris]|uniref:Thiolase family protein n=1 Tax=Zhongshania aquimaris TaxID=2857107 RepID=A0ABS6VXF8_9GAMM|nr:thiolase family protein [Zhongshania aquimaris]MBW2942719.1 thiolase family protein [Zhongshania aquimaris]
MTRGACAIVGMGVTAQGLNLGLEARELRSQAVDLALADAGLERDAIDGYIRCFVDREDLRYMGLSPNFSVSMMTGGATPVFSLLTAIGMIQSGQAEMVACVYGEAHSARAARGVQPIGAYGYGYPMLYGLMGAAATHAFHARRHMHLYGTTSRHLGAVAVTQRDYAVKRPGTLGYGKPITLDEHQASPMIADPFRRLDCTRDTDGGVAVLVTSAERARQLHAKPIYLLGGGTGHNIANWHKGVPFDNHDNIEPAKRRAFAQAGMTIADIDMAQLYDPFTISPLMQLEAYGVIAAGQGGAFYADGGAGPEGKMPTNTGGGQLSAYYTTGFTGIIEAIIQLRGDAGEGQLKKAGTALVSGHGMNAGVQNTWAHASLILGSEQ